MTRQRTAGHNRLRVLTYNILLGGERREQLITDVLRRADADVCALQEVRNLDFARELAAALRAEMYVGEPSDGAGLNLVILSRRKVSHARNHLHRGRMLRSHLECDIQTGGRHLPTVRIHCVHLAARFGERANGEARRMRELSAILAGVRRGGARPHLLVGDFNAVAPGDGVAATAFFKRMAELRRARLVERQADGLMGPRRREGADEEIDRAWLRAGIDPRLDMGIPQLPAIVYPLTARLPRSERLDQMLGRFVERWSVEHLLEQGYVDCYRRLHPRAKGYTCATWLPAARIDYIFATPDVASGLRDCGVVGGRGHADHDAAVASDHFPLIAEFAV